MRGLRLEQTQRLLWKLITAPEGAAAGFRQLTDAERVDAASLVHGDARLDPLARIDVYADMYFYRIHDALKEDFPAVCAVIGANRFHNLMTDYLLQHPPSHFSLRYAGRDLPAFLDSHGLAQRWPYVADLARLECAVLDAFDAPDAAPLEAASLASVAQERWPALRFRVTPSLQLLQLGWPVHETLTRVQGGESPADLEPSRIVLRVWRRQLRVFHQPMDAAESAALSSLLAAAPFGEVCEAVATFAGEANGAERAADLLRQWLADDLLVGFSVE